MEMDKRLLSKQQRLTDWVARPVARPNYMLIKEMHFTHEDRDRPNSQYLRVLSPFY